MCCCANIKFRYIGTDQTYWTTNQVYQVFAVDAAGGIRFALFSTTDNQFHAVLHDTDWELVSVSYPSETQLYP